MNIGVVIGRIGGVDGVALESTKWNEAFESLGHQVHILAGKLQDKRPNVTLMPQLDFHHPQNVRAQGNAFFKQNISEDRLLSNLRKESAYVERGILRWIIKNKIEAINVQNSLALPCHLSMGIALRKVIEETGIKCIAHHHDFYWERGVRYKTSFADLRRRLRSTFPPQIDGMKHVVINKQAQTDLKKKLDLESVVVPNVMDFSKPFATRDRYNANIRKELGFEKDDIILAQVTRIVRRKGIHTAIDLVHRLDNPKIKLVITGSAIDDENREYFCELKDKVEELKLSDNVFFAGDRFATSRHSNIHKDKMFSLEDAYAQATACTYFSTYEGFGNAFVECILAKRPIFVNNYKPVYWPDIGSLGFKAVMTENGKLTDKHVQEVADILTNPKKAKEIAEHNYRLGKKHFSLQVLKRLLKPLI